MRKTDDWSLKQILDALETWARPQSKDALQAAILRYATDLHRTERATFFARLAKEPVSAKRAARDSVEDIQARITAVCEEIKERGEAIENGEPVEGADDDYGNDRWHGGYDDDDPAMVSEDQETELDDILATIERLAVAGRHADAAATYGSFFQAVDHLADGSDYDLFSGMQTGWLPHKALYCRCLYETAEPAARAERLAAVMPPLTPRRPYGLPQWAAVVTASAMKAALAGTQPEWDEFLHAWASALATDASPQAQLLGVEAAFLLHGAGAARELTENVAPLKTLAPVRHFLVDMLANCGAPEEGLAAGQKALADFAGTDNIAPLAHQLAALGEKHGNADAVINARWELLLYQPAAAELLALLVAAQKANDYARQLARVVEHLAQQSKTSVALVAACLATGDLAAAFARASTIPALGWSSPDAPGPVLYAGVLAALALPKLDAAPHIRRLLERHANDSRFSHSTLALMDEDVSEDGGDDEGENEPEDSAPALSVSAPAETQANAKLSDFILRGLATADITEARRTAYLAWAEKVALQRVDGIVSNSHRGAYDRAVEVLVACGECLAANGQARRAHELLRTTETKYRRHYAFTRTLKAAQAQSTMLR